MFLTCLLQLIQLILFDFQNINFLIEQYINFHFIVILTIVIQLNKIENLSLIMDFLIILLILNTNVSMNKKTCVTVEFFFARSNLSL